MNWVNNGSSNGLTPNLYWHVACSAPNHCLNQWWPMLSWTFRNKLQWNFNRKIEKKSSKKMYLKMSACGMGDFQKCRCLSSVFLFARDNFKGILERSWRDSFQFLQKNNDKVPVLVHAIAQWRISTEPLPDPMVVNHRTWNDCMKLNHSDGGCQNYTHFKFHLNDDISKIQNLHTIYRHSTHFIRRQLQTRALAVATWLLNSGGNS